MDETEMVNQQEKNGMKDILVTQPHGEHRLYQTDRKANADHTFGNTVLIAYGAEAYKRLVTRAINRPGWFVKGRDV